MGSCIRTLNYLLNYVIVYCMARLGLFTPPEEDTYNAGDTADNVMILDRSCPSLVSVPVRALISSIKMNLPIVLYGNHVTKLRGHQKVGKCDEEVCCSVCLDRIATHDEVRELSNCEHLFHRECLDRWLDEGQFSCPFCRSMLLPLSINPRMVLKNNQ